MPDSNITKKALSQTLKELLKKKPLAKISIGDICEHCGINRKTFYYHFKDKYDLVNWIYYNEFVVVINRREDTISWNYANDLCNYLYENRDFYRKTFYMNEQNSFTEYFKEFIQSIIEDDIQISFGEDMTGDDLDFCTEFYSNAFVVAIRNWILSSDPISPEHFVRLLKNCLVKTSHVIENAIED